MKDALLIVAFVLAAWALLGWASAPAEVYTTREHAVVLQARVDAQATEISLLQPTPRPCNVPPHYPVC